MKRIFAILLLLMLLTACASSPKLYPNEKYQQVGKEGSQKDIDDCTTKADAFLESSKGKQILKGAGSGAAVGTAVGGVLGLFGGGFLRGAVTGAAVGAAAGGTRAAVKPDQLKRAFINHCLADKGYEVIGWD